MLQHIIHHSHSSPQAPPKQIPTNSTTIAHS